jgi:hypothetical protein
MILLPRSVVTRSLSKLSVVVSLTCMAAAQLVAPSVASASEWPVISLREMVEKSGAIVRARATTVDPNAYNKETNEAFTRVDFEILEVLSGKVDGRQLSFLLRGGVLPDGMLEVNSLTTNFVPGETSLLFIKDGAYYVSPFVHGYAFRESNIEGQNVYADDKGHIVDITDAGPAEDTRKVNDAQTLQAIAWGWAGAGAERAAERAPNVGQPAPHKRGESTPQPNLYGASKASAKALPTAASVLQRVKAKIQELRATDKRVRGAIELKPRTPNTKVPSDA